MNHVPENFGASIPRFSPTPSGSTFQYHIAIRHGLQEWEVIKRFSDFDALLYQLDDSRYGNLPKLPPKTLSRPLDVESATERQKALQRLLHELLQRPDLRCSLPVKDFLEVESRISTLADKNLQPAIMRTFEDPRYSVSSIVPVPRETCVLAVQQDASSLSRLGRVWTIVEPDELGIVHLWQHTGEGGWSRKEDISCHQKPVCVLHDPVTEKIFAGFNNGQVKVLGLDLTRTVKRVFANDVIQMHHMASVVDMSLAGGRLLSIGYDASMRIIETGSHAICGGGKIGKRLPEDVYLTKCFLDADCGRAFLGTSGFDVLVFSVEKNPPEFLYHFEFPSNNNIDILSVSPSQTNLLPIPLDGRYVSGIARANNVIAIAHSNEVALFPYMPAKHEDRLFKKKIVDFCAYEDSHIVDCSVASERSVIVAGYSNGGVAIWNYEAPTPLLVVQAHEGGVSRVLWLDSTHPWGPALLTGGNEGKVHTWSFDADIFVDYKHWTPNKSLPSATTASGGIGGANGVGGTLGVNGGGGGLGDSGPRIVGKSTFATEQLLAQCKEETPEQRPIRAGLQVPEATLSAPTLKQPDEEDSDDDLRGVF
ncbi:unnamed protein product [Amoebophrya sp. A25]|nr:unnamed protein product [Amoebophrya sp. A25]|eukprot:GSA25T00004879001.1